MHELSLTEALLEVVLRHAKKHEAGRVTAVDILVGELSGFVDESIQFYWELVAQGTVAEGSLLRFRRQAGTLVCGACGREFSVREPDFLCPSCGSVTASPGRGRDCSVESIEIEEAIQQ